MGFEPDDIQSGSVVRISGERIGRGYNLNDTQTDERVYVAGSRIVAELWMEEIFKKSHMTPNDIDNTLPIYKVFDYIPDVPLNPDQEEALRHYRRHTQQ